MGRSVHRLLRLLTVAAVFVLAACDDPFGPQPWNPNPVEITLYSASRPAYIGLVSALDLVAEPVSAVPIEAPGATGQWDVVLVDLPGGGLALAPADALGGAPQRVGIAVIENRSFIEITEAPRESEAYSEEPVALRAGVVYVIRSRRGQCGFMTGHRYAKMQPIEIDAERGIYRFAVLRNPFCDDRALVPPQD
jgi:hypothetical protein